MLKKSALNCSACCLGEGETLGQHEIQLVEVRSSQSVSSKVSVLARRGSSKRGGIQPLQRISILDVRIDIRQSDSADELLGSSHRRAY